MKHIETKVLWDFTLGQINDKEKDQIAMHLKDCTKCRQEHKEQLLLHESLYELEQNIPSLSFFSQVA